MKFCDRQRISFCAIFLEKYFDFRKDVFLYKYVHLEDR